MASEWTPNGPIDDADQNELDVRRRRPRWRSALEWLAVSVASLFALLVFLSWLWGPSLRALFAAGTGCHGGTPVDETECLAGNARACDRRARDYAGYAAQAERRDVEFWDLPAVYARYRRAEEYREEAQRWRSLAVNARR